MAGVSSIFQLLYSLMPGQDTNNYFICTGKFPSEQVGEVKRNYPVWIIGFLSLLIYIVACVRIQAFKIKIHQQENQNGNLNSSNIQTMYSFATNLITLLFILLCFWLPFKVNRFKAHEINLYPNYLWVYLLHHYVPESGFALVSFCYFSANTALKNWARNEIWNTWNRIRNFVNSSHSIYPIDL